MEIQIAYFLGDFTTVFEDLLERSTDVPNEEFINENGLSMPIESWIDEFTSKTSDQDPTAIFATSEEPATIALQPTSSAKVDHPAFPDPKKSNQCAESADSLSNSQDQNTIK